MKIYFIGNEVVGRKCLDHLLEEGHDVLLAGKRVEDITPDVIVNVHGRDKIPPSLLSLARYGGINLHPFLDAYPGKDPVGRWMANGAEGPLRVMAHRLTDVIDGGEVLATASSALMLNPATRAQVYRWLYPLYLKALDGGLDCVHSS